MNMKNFIKLNIFNFIMIITLALTWPNFYDGLIKGLLIVVKINIFCLVFAVYHEEIYDALMSLKMPEKLKILLIMTLRGVYILKDRFDAAMTSLKLRASEQKLHGFMKFKTFAYVIGSVLLQSLRRSENISRAIYCRGGYSGFNQTKHKKFSRNKLILTLYLILVISLSYV